MRRERKRILAVASGGGHWVQLMRLRAAFDDLDVAYVTVSDHYRREVAGRRFYRINDGNRNKPWAILVMTLRIAAILLRERPDMVVSTGAAPGGLAVWLGRMMGCRTVWIDSIANVNHLSMSGAWAGRWAHLWLTQWPHLAAANGPRFEGAVL